MAITTVRTHHDLTRTQDAVIVMAVVYLCWRLKGENLYHLQFTFQNMNIQVIRRRNHSK